MMERATGIGLIGSPGFSVLTSGVRHFGDFIDAFMEEK